MALQPFTRNYADNSTEVGFQFTFYCDLCQSGYKTRFIECKSANQAGFFQQIAKALSFGAACLGHSDIGNRIERGADVITERFEGMSVQWQKEHEAAFIAAQEEAKGHFYRCPRCRLWVCREDWNEEEGLCTQCSPRLNVEIAAAKAEKMVLDIKAQAENTTVFDGQIETKQTVCPKCNKPVSQGKFCTHCGADLSFRICPQCKANLPANTKFCGDCGTKL